MSLNPLAVAFTHPIINIDQTGLSFRQRQGPTGPEFSFDTGTLRLQLRHEMWISNALSNCAQQRWLVHENDHVRDNQRVMTQMDAAIRSYPTLRSLLINPGWTPRARFTAIGQAIFNAVSSHFRSLDPISAQLFSQLEQRELGWVEIPFDYYWDISKDERYEPYEKPKHFDLGQLSDDWGELQKISQGENEPITYALVWLSSILRAIGEVKE